MNARTLPPLARSPSNTYQLPSLCPFKLLMPQIPSLPERLRRHYVSYDLLTYSHASKQYLRYLSPTSASASTGNSGAPELALSPYLSNLICRQPDTHVHALLKTNPQLSNLRLRPVSKPAPPCQSIGPPHDMMSASLLRSFTRAR